MRLALILLLALSGCMPTPAFSHSWYPKDCCSDADCNVLASSRVQVTPAGYVIDGRETVPHNKVLFSPDEHYHGCFPSSMMGKVGCFWAPQRAYDRFHVRKFGLHVLLHQHVLHLFAGSDHNGVGHRMVAPGALLRFCSRV